MSAEYTLPSSGSGRVATHLGAAAQGRARYLVGAVCVALCGDHARAARRVGLGLAEDHRGGGGDSADLFHPPAQPRQLPAALGLSGGAADLSLQQRRGAAADHRLLPALTIPAGYALARFPVPGKEFIFVFLLLALIVPYQALLTPIFFMFAQLKLTNSLVGLAIVHTAIQLPFSVYIMRNSFEAVPRELEEAAVIDGATSWQVLRHILSRPSGRRSSRSRCSPSSPRGTSSLARWS